MKRGANAFPFHNLLPYSESNEGLFLFFSPSLNWRKEKSVATIAIRNIFAIKRKTNSQSQFTVLHLPIFHYGLNNPMTRNRVLGDIRSNSLRSSFKFNSL